jgi:myo-inositol-1(or 4)-monophosphatase
MSDLTDHCPISPDALLEAVAAIARGAGGILMRHFDRLTAGQVVMKDGQRDLLTVADSESEAFVIAAIRELFPRHGILGEETGHFPGSGDGAGFLWVIDPLDGTTNYARSFPFFACSIGVLWRGEPVAGVVEAPRLAETFAAASGQGAWLNGSRIRVSAGSELGRAILATGFSYNRNTVARNNVDNFGKLVLKVHDIRRAGAASVDLGYVAAGRFDGYWEMYLKPWDVAAGALVVREAGGKVTGFDGSDDPRSWLWSEHLVATNGAIHAELRGELSGTEPGYAPVWARLGARE